VGAVCLAMPTAWVRGRSGLVLSGGVDVVVGVVDGFGEVHRCPGANAVIEGLGVERVVEGHCCVEGLAWCRVRVSR
jgi:hypothetical protein